MIMTRRCCQFELSLISTGLRCLRAPRAPRCAHRGKRETRVARKRSESSATQRRPSHARPAGAGPDGVAVRDDRPAYGGPGRARRTCATAPTRFPRPAEPTPTYIARPARPLRGERRNLGMPGQLRYRRMRDAAGCASGGPGQPLRGWSRRRTRWGRGYGDYAVCRIGCRAVVMGGSAGTTTIDCSVRNRPMCQRRWRTLTGPLPHRG